MGKFTEFLNFKSKPKQRASAVASALDGTAPFNPSPAAFVPIALVAPLPAVTIEQLSVRGHRPIVTVSKARALCEGCKEPVKAGVRHICLWNAHHHIDTLTAEERTRLIAQLKALGVKDPVPEPPKPKRSRRS